MPLLTHLYADCVWKAIGVHLGILRYVPEVVICHKHYFTGKVEKDDTFKRTNSRDMYELDDQAFHMWIKLYYDEDCNKVKEALKDGYSRAQN